MIKLIDDELHIDDLILKDGDVIFGSIYNVPTIGKLRIEKGILYFCQDIRSGSEPKDRNFLKYLYSWQFRIRNNSFTDDVKIESKFKTGIVKHISRDKKYILEIKLICKNNKIIRTENRILFSYKNHPDCCGAIIFYNFDTSELKKYSRYGNLNIDNLKSYLSAIKPSKIAHIASYQVNSHNLLKELGFKNIHTYKNKNSGREITIYQLD